MDVANDDHEARVAWLIRGLGGGRPHGPAQHREMQLAAERTVALAPSLQLEEAGDLEVLAALCFVLGRHAGRVFNSPEVAALRAREDLVPGLRLRRIVSLVLGRLPLAA